MVEAVHAHIYQNPLYLHNEFQKFWEITLDPTTYTASIRQGSLLGNQKENILSVKIEEQPHETWGEAVQYANSQVNSLLSNGYEVWDQPPSRAPDLQRTLADSKESLKIKKRYKRRPQGSFEEESLKQMKKTVGFGSTETLEIVPKENKSSLGRLLDFFKRILSIGDSDSQIQEISLVPGVLRDVADFKERCDATGLSCEIYDNEIRVKGEPEKIEMMQGYLKQIEEDKQRSEEVICKEFCLSEGSKMMIDLIEQKADQWNVEYELEGQKLSVIGSLDSVTAMIEFLLKLESAPTTNNTSSVSEELSASIESREDGNTLKEMNDNLSMLRSQIKGIELKQKIPAQEPVQEELKLLRLFNSQFTKIMDRIDELDKKMQGSKTESGEENTEGKQLEESLGNIVKKINSLEQKIDDTRSFSADLEAIYGKLKKFAGAKFTSNVIKGDTESFNTKNTRNTARKSLGDEEEEESYCQKEIPLSTFHRSLRREIEIKASEFGLMCEFGYEIILATGDSKKIGSFMTFLSDLELKATRELYPKFWNFTDIRKYALMPVPKNSEEFIEINCLFNSGAFPCRQIVKLERIQNKYLIDHYITHIQKRKELRRDNTLQRKLLFYGTKDQNPDVIYRKSDVGFDLQFAENRGYGKGLYFSNATGLGVYSHNAYRTANGTYQLLVADVLVGKAKYCNGHNVNYLKAPEGHDSVTENGNVYAIFNNFHSYPLYLLEYC